MSKPVLYANDRGIWLESRPGHPFGIEWSEIFRITGYKLDCVTEVDVVLEVDFEFGEFIELNHHWPGFDQVVQAITQKMPGIDPMWFEQLKRLQVKDDPLAVWQRS